jgi:hypothetical protein
MILEIDDDILHEVLTALTKRARYYDNMILAFRNQQPIEQETMAKWQLKADKLWNLVNIQIAAHQLRGFNYGDV